LNYTGHYDDTTTVPSGSVASWTTVDAQVAYAPTSIKGLTVSLSAVNIFDRDPPYVAGTNEFDSTIHYDVANGNPLGRQVTLGGRFDW
jgi:outer membrane receptor protein involved in Fe transport